MKAASRDPDVLGGEPVFAGTRVPVGPGQHGTGPPVRRAYGSERSGEWLDSKCGKLKLET